MHVAAMVSGITREVIGYLAAWLWSQVMKSLTDNSVASILLVIPRPIRVVSALASGSSVGLVPVAALHVDEHVA